jgi:hypothetical protein
LDTAQESLEVSLTKMATVLYLALDPWVFAATKISLGGLSDTFANNSGRKDTKEIFGVSSDIIVTPEDAHLLTVRSVADFNQSLKSEPHRSIVAQGLPDGALPSFAAQTRVLPPVPFRVYDTRDAPAFLYVESDALLIRGSDGSEERVLLNTIVGRCVEYIDEDECYFALGLLTARDALGLLPSVAVQGVLQKYG